jgi:hypothetical protein
MRTRTLHCPNCSAPLEVPLGETEALCEFCSSRLRLLPGEEEMAVVRTREEMRYRERVAVQKAILEKRLQQEETERWRRAAAKVAIASLPVVGNAAGRALFGAAVRRGGGCLGCGCTAMLVVLAGIVAALLGGLGRPL